MGSDRNLIVALAVLAAFAAGFFTANVFHYGFERDMPYQQYRAPAKAEYSSNGEMIFMTGINDRGERIPFTAGPQ